jgi:NADH-quinone oxidoreductase subunit N
MESMNLLAALPEAVVLTAACVILLVDVFIGGERRLASYVLTLVTLAAVAAIAIAFLAGDVVLYAFGGMYVTDPMANLLKLAAVLTTAFVLVCSQQYARGRELWRGELFVLMLFSLLGILVMISANNLLVIYLGLELQTLSMYALIALRRDDVKATEAAMKYFVLGALASGFLLYGMSLLYGATASLDIDDIAQRVSTGEVASQASLVLGLVFIVAGLAFKLGVVPFHMWVPDVYEGAPTPITMMIGSAPKFAAFAVAFRLLVEGLIPLAVDWQQMLMLLAIASLVIGNLTAIAQTNLKRMLAYSTIAQMGFMLLALMSGVANGQATNAAGAYTAAMFYVLTYGLTTLAAFGIILLLTRQGFEAEAIDDFKGLNKRSPWYAFVMMLAMLSLAGIPPLVGFYAKLVVLQALLSAGATTLTVGVAVTAIVFSLIGSYYYLRVVKVMYFDEPADSSGADALTGGADMRVALSVVGALILLLGIAPQLLLDLVANAMIKTLGG